MMSKQWNEWLGLQLNHSKTEIICGDHSTRTAMLQVSPDFCPVSPQQATLLGSPIGDEEGADKSITEKIKALDIMGEKLRHIHVHDVFVCFIMPLHSPRYCIH